MMVEAGQLRVIPIVLIPSKQMLNSLFDGKGIAVNIKRLISINELYHLVCINSDVTSYYCSCSKNKAWNLQPQEPRPLYLEN